MTTTTVGTQSTTVSSTQVTKGGFGLTGQIGKVFFQRYDLSLGMLYGDGAARLKINLGPKENLSMVQWQSDLYFRGASTNGNWTVQADVRTYLIYQPISIFYVSAGVEGFRQAGGSFQYLAGAGIRFDDEDIKLLLSLK